MTPTARRWALIFACSGAIGLSYEVVWMRRLGLLLGATAPASAVTVGAFMGGLGLGSALSGRLRGDPARTYAVLETCAAAWALAFPLMFAAATTITHSWPLARWPLAVILLLPPASALGAT